MLCFFPLSSECAEKLQINTDSTVLSRFVWRGEMWTDDPVLWQTVTLRYGGFRYYNFFNVDLTDINNDKFECNEYDFILDYSIKIGRISIAPGLLRFTSPTNFFKTTTKITCAIKTDYFLSPSLRLRFDPEGTKGSYYILDLSQSIQLKHPFKEIGLYASLGASQPRYYRKYLDKGISLTDMLLGVNLPLYLGKGCTLSPLVEFTSLLDNSVRNAQFDTGAKKDAFTYGITFSKMFEL